jgi:hypothetical protein
MAARIGIRIGWLALAWMAAACGFDSSGPGGGGDDDASPGPIDAAPIGDGAVTPDGATSDPDAGEPPVTCAEACAGIGSCQGQTCIIDCTLDDSCDEAVTCPDDIDCEVRCHGDRSCSGGVDCGAASACVIECDGTDSCDQQNQCGKSQCSVICSGQNSCVGGTRCSMSCACDVSCGGSSSCDTQATCPTGCDDGKGCTSGGLCDTCAI